MIQIQTQLQLHTALPGLYLHPLINSDMRSQIESDASGSTPYSTTKNHCHHASPHHPAAKRSTFTYLRSFNVPISTQVIA
jgi:hypothetical protein